MWIVNYAHNVVQALQDLCIRYKDEITAMADHKKLGYSLVPPPLRMNHKMGYLLHI
jgi:hypothetical protein